MSFKSLSMKPDLADDGKKCLLCFKVHYIMMTKPINSTGPTFHASQDERITDGINDFEKSR